MNSSGGEARMLAGLLEASHLSALEQLPALVSEHAAFAGLSEVRIYLADLQQDVLRLLTGHGEDAGRGEDSGTTELRIDGTLAGRAFQEVRVLPRTGEDGAVRWWWVPLLDGTERLGVLRVSAARQDGRAQESMRGLASLVALLVVSKRSHSDSYARLTRTRPMTVAAEMQWNLMPPLTFASENVMIAAALEPAYEIGGDAFDYALAGDIVHLGLFDAMGHDASAGLTANLAVAACRNHRRQGADLVRTGEAIERTLIEEFGRASRYATAILAELDMRDGMLSWVNRGHHPPVLIRGGRWTTNLGCKPAHPLGLDLGLPATVCRRQLEPGDRLLFYTDGIIEARDGLGREFGLTRFVDFVIRHNAAGLPVPETLRRLVQNLLNHHSGHLQDDATVVFVEWQGPAHRRLHL